MVDENYLKNKSSIPEVLYKFCSVNDFENEDMYINAFLYSYLCLGKCENLRVLQHYLNESEIISLIENKTKNVLLLVNLYQFYNQKEKLWNLLINSNYQYLLLENVEILKDKYNKELYNYFIKEFYNTLREGKKREVYEKSIRYIKAISKLNNGIELVQKIIKDLKKSEYKNCPALFDEIWNSINN